MTRLLVGTNTNIANIPPPPRLFSPSHSPTKNWIQSNICIVSIFEWSFLNFKLIVLDVVRRLVAVSGGSDICIHYPLVLLWQEVRYKRGRVVSGIRHLMIMGLLWISNAHLTTAGRVKPGHADWTAAMASVATSHIFSCIKPLLQSSARFPGPGAFPWWWSRYNHPIEM